VLGYAEAVGVVREGQVTARMADAAAAAYLRGVADGYACYAASEHIESVWSGPSSHAVPVRSTAQVLVELIGEAVGELVLMTYAARPHPPVLDALNAPRARGDEDDRRLSGGRCGRRRSTSSSRRRVTA